MHEAVSLAAPGGIFFVNGEAETTPALMGEMLGARGHHERRERI
jgi:regulator of RNase E activity RraA